MSYYLKSLLRCLKVLLYSFLFNNLYLSRPTSRNEVGSYSTIDSKFYISMQFILRICELSRAEDGGVEDTREEQLDRHPDVCDTDDMIR